MGQLSLCAATAEPMLQGPWATTTEAPAPVLHDMRSHRNVKPCAPQLESSPHSLQLEKAHVQQQRSSSAKYIKINNKKTHIGFWKRQNYGESKKISCCQGRTEFIRGSRRSEHQCLEAPVKKHFFEGNLGWKCIVFGESQQWVQVLTLLPFWQLHLEQDAWLLCTTMLSMSILKLHKMSW